MRYLSLAVLIAFAPGASAQWTILPWVTICQSGAPPETCDRTRPGTADDLISDQLNESTVWLHGMGFREPAVDRSAGSPHYVMRIGPDGLQVGDDHVFGFYSRTSATSGTLVVDPTHFITFEGRDDASGTPTHEVFHAVQGAYASFETENGAADWIIEGTAQAVEAAYLRRFQDLPVFEDVYSHLSYGADSTMSEADWMISEAPVLSARAHAYAYGHRDYGVPLYSTEEKNQEYATAHFWLALGEMLGSQDRVRYLHEVLEASGDEPGAMLQDVVSRYYPDGFAHLFPRLLGRFATSKDHFGIGSRWRAKMKSGSEKLLDRTVEPLAAHFYQLQAAPSVKGSVLVEVEFDEQNPNLHYVFNGTESEELDLETTPEGTTIYRKLLRSDERAILHVVNVAPSPEASVAEPYAIRLRGVEPCDGDTYFAQAEMTISGPSGMIATGDDPGVLQTLEGDIVALAAIPSPVGHYMLRLPIEPLEIEWDEVALTLHPAANLTRSDGTATMYFASPTVREIEEIRASEGMTVTGEITSAVPEGSEDLDQLMSGSEMIVGSFEVDKDPPSYSDALSFSMARGGVRRGTMLSVGVKASAEPGAYAMTPGTSNVKVSVRAGDFALPWLNESVLVTLHDVEPGRCVAGTFGGTMRFDKDEPGFHASGSFLVRAPAGLDMER